MPTQAPGAPSYKGGIRGQAPCFEVRPEQTLLQAIEQAGLRWPSSCRSGSCRTCLGTLLQGQVRYEMPWPGLSADEKAAACVLPCAAYPLSDVVLRDPFED